MSDGDTGTGTTKAGTRTLEMVLITFNLEESNVPFGIVRVARS